MTTPAVNSFSDLVDDEELVSRITVDSKLNHCTLAIFRLCLHYTGQLSLCTCVHCIRVVSCMLNEGDSLLPVFDFNFSHSSGNQKVRMVHGILFSYFLAIFSRYDSLLIGERHFNVVC